MFWDQTEATFEPGTVPVPVPVLSLIDFKSMLVYNTVLFVLFVDPDDPYKLTDDTRQLGLVVCRGTSVVLICPVDGMESIANPFVTQDSWFLFEAVIMSCSCSDIWNGLFQLKLLRLYEYCKDIVVAEKATLWLVCRFVIETNVNSLMSLIATHWISVTELSHLSKFCRLQPYCGHHFFKKTSVDWSHVIDNCLNDLREACNACLIIGKI